MATYVGFVYEGYSTGGGLRDSVYVGRSLKAAKAAVEEAVRERSGWVPAVPEHHRKRGPRGATTSSFVTGIGGIADPRWDPEEIITVPARPASFKGYDGEAHIARFGRVPVVVDVDDVTSAHEDAPIECVWGDWHPLG